jgi:predicted glycosyltransferase
MLSLDKIKKGIQKEVFETINLLVQEGNKEQLIKWLKECKDEITRREEQKENTYCLHLEKTYLEYVLR